MTFLGEVHEVTEADVASDEDVVVVMWDFENVKVETSHFVDSSNDVHKVVHSATEIRNHISYLLSHF